LRKAEWATQIAASGYLDQNTAGFLKMAWAKPAGIGTVGLFIFRILGRNIFAPLLKRGILSSPDNSRKRAVIATRLLKMIFLLTLYDFSRKPPEAYGTNAVCVSNEISQFVCLKRFPFRVPSSGLSSRNPKTKR
jgi:hypothetical protein